MVKEILEDFKEHGFDYKKLHDHYAAKLDELKDTNLFTLYHETQVKLNGLYSMYKNGELPKSNDVKELEVVPLDDKNVPVSLVPVSEKEKEEDPWANFR